MCGISGLYYFDSTRIVEDSVLTAMRSVATHRGPDDHGIFCGGNIGFSFSRLSIIDVISGHQPMANEDGSVWLVFNGEIYNFRQLRRELLSRGHQFRTQ